MQTGKYTLLEMTQAILEKMDSDEINSIWDTPESIAVAGEVRDTYWSMISGMEDRQRKSLIRLESVSDEQYFNQMRVPDNVIIVETVRYKINDEWRTIPYVDPDTFLQNSYNRSGYFKEVKSSPSDPKAGYVRVGTNANPSCYTTFDNQIFFFDSVDQQIETTLQESKSGAWATSLPPFEMKDTFVPALRVDEFAGFLNDCVAACFIHFKGVSNAKSEKRARDQMVRGQNNRIRGRNRTVQQYKESRGRRRGVAHDRILKNYGGVSETSNTPVQDETYTTEGW